MNPGDTNKASKASTIRARLKYPDESTFIKKYAANVTRSELFLKTAKPKPVGTQVRFEIQIASGDTMLRGIGVVAWARTEPEAGEPAGMGLKFKKLDAKTKQVVGSILAHKKKLTVAAGEKPPISEDKPAKRPASRKDRDVRPLRTKKRTRTESKTGELDTLTDGSSTPAKEKRPVKRTRTTADLGLDDLERPTRRKRTTESRLDGDLEELPRRRESAEERELAREKRRKEREEERERRRAERRKARAAEKAEKPANRDEITRPDYQIDELTGTRAKLEEEIDQRGRESKTEVAPEEVRQAPADSEPELELDSNEALEIEPDTGELDIDDMLNTTLVEHSQPEKPLHLDSGYISIKSLAPDMPHMEALDEDQDDIFEDRDKPQKVVKKAEEVEISDDAARLTDFILGGSDVDDDMSDGAGDLDLLVEPVDDEDEDDEVLLDIDASHVEAEPAGLNDMTTQLDLESEDTGSLLDALATANADNKIGKDRLDNLIDEMTRDSVDPGTKDPLLATKDVGAALDEIFVSVDEEEPSKDLFGLEDAPMTLPDEAVPEGLVREQSLPGLYDEPEIPIDTDDSGVEEIPDDEDEEEKGRRVSFFKKLFGG